MKTLSLCFPEVPTHSMDKQIGSHGITQMLGRQVTVTLKPAIIYKRLHWTVSHHISNLVNWWLSSPSYWRPTEVQSRQAHEWEKSCFKNPVELSCTLPFSLALWIPSVLFYDLKCLYHLSIFHLSFSQKLNKHGFTCYCLHFQKCILIFLQ